MESSVDLGFIEKAESYLLTNRYFPSKVGGRPAWLDLEKIPESVRLKCNDCASELVFLCQVISYLNQEKFLLIFIIFFIKFADLCTHR